MSFLCLRVGRLAAVAAVVAGCTAPRFEPSRPVRFVGATSLSEVVLREVVAESLLTDTKEDELRAAAGEAIARAYRVLGFADVSVAGASEAGGLVFTIQEGRRWSLASVDVQGSLAISRDELLRLWRIIVLPDGRLVEAPPFSPGDPFDSDHLKRFAGLVLSRYLDSGYLDARLDRPQLERDQERGSVQVTLRVAQEGPRYTISKYDVPDAVHAVLGDDMPKAPVGEVCTRARAEGFAAAILGGLRRRGFPEPELRVSADRNASKGEVELHLAIETGVPRTVSEVQVVGNRRVPLDLVRDKFGMQPGQLFDGDVERRGVAALSATGEFSTIDVDYERHDTDKVKVIVDTAESSGLVLKGSPYLHPWRRFGYNMFIEGRDALGERHDLLGHVHVGHRGYNLGGRYLRSGLFDQNTSLTIGGDFYANERPAFTDRGAGGTIELRRYFSPGLSVAASYSALEHFRTSVDSTSTTSIGSDYTEGRASLALDFDQTDNRLLPTRGQKAYARVDRVDDALSADVEFTRLRVGAGLWVPLSERVRVSLEADSGWLWPGGDSAAVPIPERFFLGGYDSVRSFRESRVGPRDSRGALSGGEFKNFARSELVVRTVDPLDVALFADAGNIGADVSAWTLNDMRYALGVALRLAARETGPVVLSAAFNPDRAPGEDQWVVDFAAGVIF